MGKRIKNIYDKALTYDCMYKAYLHSKKGKTNRIDVIEFGLNYEEKLKEMLLELSNLTYTFGKYTLFYIYEPKERRILSAPFKDRIVHTWYVENFIKPYFVPSFMYHSYACINNKGTHKCAIEVKKIIKRCEKKCKSSYILKMDISKYFENIDRNVLYNIICKKVKDKKFIYLTQQILDSASENDLVPKKGLPIGNYCSQMFANIYLNELDKYLKEDMKLKYVCRYMDDVVIVLKDKQEAKEVLQKIKAFLKETLLLELNKKTNIFKISQGVNFCGYKINMYRMRIRDRGKKKVISKLKKIRRKINEGNISIQDAKRQLAGHIGYMKIADVKGLTEKYF